MRKESKSWLQRCKEADAREQEERKNEYGSEYVRLKYAIMYGQHTDEEWLQLGREVCAFVKGDHPEREKRLLGTLDILTRNCFWAIEEKYKEELQKLPDDEKTDAMLNYLSQEMGRVD